MNDKIIFHLVKKDWWEQHQKDALYFPEQFATENFIHCSTRAQLHASANAYYANETIVCLLHLDTGLLTSELKYEMSPSRQQFFPHIYGPINKEAIVAVERLTKSAGDTWNL